MTKRHVPDALEERAEGGPERILTSAAGLVTLNTMAAGWR